jgi:protein-L-isoaspartate(D-aspartate) O-methyltransferase
LALLARLVDEVKQTDNTALNDPRWEAVFRRVPRHVFLSGFYLDTDEAGDRSFVDPTDNERWLNLVYSNRPLVTRVSDSRPLSSSSMPSMMARFLKLLDVKDGNRVLEIGTGTGYNAALLCGRLGSEYVTSIDIDAALVESAQRALTEYGVAPTLAVADGLTGYPQCAPYDRIIATCAVSRIPNAWIEQLRPDGAIVTPLAAPIDRGLIALREQGDRTLQGRLDPDGAAFMPLRHDTSGNPEWRELLRLVHRPDPGTDTAAGDVEAPEWLQDPWNAGSDALRMLQLLPDLEWFWFPGPDGSRTLPGIVGRRDRSWLRVYMTEDGAIVRQGGSRRLWDLLIEQHDLWLRLGMPGMSRYGMTVGADRRQFVWLDSPDSEHRWEL